ncbi:hypothetical protein ACFSQU_10900 [Massilia sp. GCM10020059]|uniref:ABM domain-containing protein n=1 Tax=Massilia agrisoli TaxID=2892444 RepID=A0ABS8IP97_9BURK|nr:hypothetical protein [Massilia agrisoli]MCC6070329.1 hypothetical protein [Massilia agrisoli]
MSGATSIPVAGQVSPGDEAVEIVTFRLAQGVSFAGFVAANREIDAWLLQQPGFKSRRIGEQPGPCVVDVLLWESEAAARAAMHRMMDELGDSPVHALIDQETVSWTVASIRHRQEIDG